VEALVSDVWNLARVLVVIGGGMVAGGGTVILLERAHFYRRRHMPQAIVAMRALIGVNLTVMVYVAAVLIDRWDDPPSWRLFGAVLVFALKGVFFHALRNTGLEQERRELYPDWDGAERRSSGDRRALTQS
jgi:MFS family permease